MNAPPAPQVAVCVAGKGVSPCFEHVAALVQVPLKATLLFASTLDEQSYPAGTLVALHMMTVLRERKACVSSSLGEARLLVRKTVSIKDLAAKHKHTSCRQLRTSLTLA